MQDILNMALPQWELLPDIAHPVRRMSAGAG